MDQLIKLVLEDARLSVVGQTESLIDCMAIFSFVTKGIGHFLIITSKYFCNKSLLYVVVLSMLYCIGE